MPSRSIIDEYNDTLNCGIIFTTIIIFIALATAYLSNNCHRSWRTLRTLSGQAYPGANPIKLFVAILLIFCQLDALPIANIFTLVKVKWIITVIRSSPLDGQFVTLAGELLYKFQIRLRLVLKKESQNSLPDASCPWPNPSDIRRACS